MTGFNAGTVVEPLDYDFRTKDNPNAIHGVVREPTDRQIADYMAGVKAVVKKLKADLPKEVTSGGDDIDMAALFMAVDDLDPEVVITFHEDMAGIFATLCSGQPSREDILGLPIRIRVMFYAWIQREVMSPEAAPGGGSNVTKLPARAG
jgi:hypothetical protein